MTSKTKAKTELVKKLASELFELMGVKAKPKVSYDVENEAVVVDVQTEDEVGLLIGSRGNTLSSIQYVLGLMYVKKSDQWQRIVVNVADWRQRQEERLEELANQAAERAVSSGNPQSLYNLNPSERRIVHMELSQNTAVETESEGEDGDRYLVVRPKSSK